MTAYGGGPMTVFGNTVEVGSADEFERVRAVPEARDGWFDPERKFGVVRFWSCETAQKVWSKHSG